MAENKSCKLIEVRIASEGDRIITPDGEHVIEGWSFSDQDQTFTAGKWGIIIAPPSHSDSASNCPDRDDELPESTFAQASS